MATFIGPNGPIEVSGVLAKTYDKHPAYSRVEVETPAETKTAPATATNTKGK